MNVLHLTSDWKFTGPAEPMLIAGAALRARGHRVDLACPSAPPGEVGVRDMARARGVDLEAGLEVERGRGIRALRDRRDVRALCSLLVEREVEVVHVWHSRAHGLALRARGARTALVRAHSDGLPVAAGWRGAPTRWMFGARCDALVCTHRDCAASHDARSIAPTASAGRGVYAVSGAVDLEQFRPLRSSEEAAAARALLGVAADAPLVGVVARVQPQRRFDLVFDALEHLRAKWPGIRLAILGRGTQIESVAHRPVAERGLDGHVVFAGQRGADYPELLRSFDALVFLVPGSDGGCRTVLEAAASGVPVVASRRGALRELVIDGTTGFSVDEEAAALVAALDALLGARELRREIARNARSHAESAFAPERLGEDFEAIYRAALQHRRR